MKSLVSLWLLLPACLATSCSRQPATERTLAPLAPRVKVAIALGTNLPVRLRVPGRVSPSSTVAVRSQVDGMLRSVHFHEGAMVQAGQLLFTVDPKPFETAVAQQKAILDKDLALERNAQTEQRMNGVLLQSKVVSQENYEESASSAASLKSAVEADQANVEAAQIGLSNCYIRAPITGRAGLVQLPPGNLINGPDEVLVSLNQIDPIFVDIALPERELPKIRGCMAREHLKVEAELPGEQGPPLLGELTTINNQVDADTGTILLRAVFTNQNETLWPGQSLQTLLSLGGMTNAVVLPAQAARSDPQGAFAFVIKPDKTLERRQVELCEQAGGNTQILLGIRPGEQVVIGNKDALSSGRRIEIEP